MSGKITLENASLTATYNDEAYTFPNVINITLTDPRENVLSASPQGNGDGIPYRTGLTLSCDNNFTIRDVPYPLLKILKKAFENQERIDFMLYDQKSNDGYELNASTIRNNISNLNVVEGESALDVPLNTQCVPKNFKHIPAEG